MKVLVPEVKDELVVLSRLMTDYEDVMERVGLLGPWPKDAKAGAVLQINVYDEFAERVKAMPDDLRNAVLGWLGQEREKHLEAKCREAQVRVVATLPDVIDMTPTDSETGKHETTP